MRIEAWLQMFLFFKTAGEQGGRGRADGDSGAARRGRPASAHVTSEATSAPQRGDRPSRCPKESQRPDGATWQVHMLCTCTVDLDLHQ